MSETTDTARPDLLRTVAAGTAGVVGEAFLQRVVRAGGETFGGGVCWISELNENGRSARSLASWPPEGLPAGFGDSPHRTPRPAVPQRGGGGYRGGGPG